MRELIFAAAICALALIVPLTAGAARRERGARWGEAARLGPPAGQ
jgi:hypothetical protein